MKTNFLFKYLFLLLSCVGVNLAYADTKAFTFNFDGITVTNVKFDHEVKNDEFPSQYKTANGKSLTVSTDGDNTSYKVNVSYNFGKDGSQSLAQNYNSYFNNDPMHIIELQGNKGIVADKLDYWLTGQLYINNELVADDFTFGYELDTKNWWIASLNGLSSYPGNAVFGSMQVHTASGKSYCLNQNNTNYSVIVTAGECNGPRPYPLTFTYVKNDGEMINSVRFEPLESPESGQIESITNTPITNGNVLDIIAAPLNSSSIADSFNLLMSNTPNYHCWSSDQQVYQFQIYMQGMGCGQPPTTLDFYVPGNLKINNRPVVNTYGDNNKKPRRFILAHGGGTWWLETLDTYFEAYGGGGWGYQNHLTVVAYESGVYYNYKLTATSSNSFKVNRVKNS